MVQKIPAIKGFTLDEVARHNGKIEETLWIIIKDCVYDVSDYLDKHPGGRDMIEELAGKDATKDFLDMGHSSDAKNHLKTLKIGEIVKVQKKNKQQQNDESNKKLGRSFVSVVTCGLMG